MASKDEFDQIVEANPDISVLGETAPDGFFVLQGVDGSQTTVAKITYMEHANAIADALKDPSADLSVVVAHSLNELEPLTFRVVMESAWGFFFDWFTNECPVESVPFSVFHMPMFVALYRELLVGVPEFTGEFLRGIVDHG